MFDSKNDLEEYLKQFITKEGNHGYFKQHSEHFFKVYEIVKKFQPNFTQEVVVDLGSKDGIFVPAIHAISPFKKTHIVDYGKKESETVKIQSSTKEIHVEKHYLNLENEPLPFEDESVDVILFLEILEHFLYDPMYVLCQINRVLKKTGFLFISTPNLTSARSFQRMLLGNNPNAFTPYKEPENVYERHNREFTIGEVKLLTSKAGFSVEEVFTHPVSCSKKINLLLTTLKILGLANIKKDEFGNLMYLVCKKNQHLDLEKIDIDTRYPAPVYRMRHHFSKKPVIG